MLGNGGAVMSEMIQLQEYIDTKHGGNKSAFARAVGVMPQSVDQWLKAKKPVYVYKDKLMAIIWEILE